MRYAIAGLMVGLMLTGAAADAQDTKVTTTTKVKADNGTAVTLAGCVMIGGSTSFLLTNITSQHIEHDKHDKAAAPSASYALLEREGLDLGSYINHRVELTGVFVPAATKGDDDDKIKITETTEVDVKNGPDKKASSSETVKVARGPVNQFLVATVKSVAPTCGS
jgi:hypothetical protein